MTDELKAKVLSLHPTSKQFLAALEIAFQTHEGMTRDDGESYINHPMRVALILSEEMGFCEVECLILALLHDCFEDDGRIALGGQKFYRGIEDDLRHLTIKIGATRAERDKYYIGQIRQASLRAKIVKIADRIDNVRSLITNPSEEKKARYVTETISYYIPLAEDVYRPSTILLNEGLEHVLRSS